jgi:hypothetical protein
LEGKRPDWRLEEFIKSSSDDLQGSTPFGERNVKERYDFSRKKGRRLAGLVPATQGLGIRGNAPTILLISVT